MQIKTSLVSPRQHIRLRLFLVFAAGLCAILLTILLRGHTPTAPDVTSLFNRLPLAFVPNQGQSDTAVHFETHQGFSFAANEITMQVGQQTLHLSFVDTNPAPVIEAGTLLPGKVNDFRGNETANWVTNLPTYADITYQQLYPGVDLQYQGTEGVLKGTFTVAPGIDPAPIRWQYGGAKAITIDDTTGDLQITLSDQVQVIEKAPVAWQEVNGRRQTVPVAFNLSGDNQIGFTLGSYDAAAPLVIDPTIVYETTTSLATFDSGRDITVDDNGQVYIVGRAYDTNNDIFVTKLSANGVVLYTTYLRGSSLDYSRGIIWDGQDGIYIAGWTDSTDFPILNAMQPIKNGNRDLFVTKLSAQTGALDFSTYFGGSRSDESHDIALDSAGNIVLVGTTDSTDFPTLNPIQNGLNLNQCFCEDVFVVKFSADASTLLYSTYLGGSFEDRGESIALDASDNIFITGRTQSDDFPTEAAIQPNRAGVNQDEDAFVARISADGSDLVYSTYLGGADREFASRIVADSAGHAFIVGSTRSINFPTTGNAYQPQFVGGVNDCGIPGFGGPRNCDDMFVTKFAPDGSALVYSTYIGGGLDDTGSGIDLDDAGQAYIVGYSQSADFPPDNGTEVTANIILTKLNAAGSELLYVVKTFSATANDGHGIAVDDNGAAYITGAQNAPADLYVAKISDDGTPPQPTPTSTAVPPTPTNTPAPPTPTNTPIPPTPGMDTMHIGDLDGNSFWVNRRLWRATVTVFVHDAQENPVVGASVNGSWSGGYSGSGQCTTDSDGRCAITTGNIRRFRSSTSFTVNDVTHQNFTYSPASNHDPDGDSNGTSIIILRP